MAQPSPCVEGKGGAYSTVLTYRGAADDESGMGDGVVAELVLWHADAQGKLSRSVGVALEDREFRGDVWKLLGVADYDGDGVEELLVHESAWAHEALGSDRGRIWHVLAGKVEPYGPAQTHHIARFEDLDDDALPDLVVETPFEGLINECGLIGDYIRFGPTYIAHANGRGDFTFDDASRARVLATCPELPRPLVPITPQGVDNDELRRRLACSVAWGRDSASILQELAETCPPPWQPTEDHEVECDFAGVLPTCAGRARLEQWAAVKPPFSLR